MKNNFYSKKTLCNVYTKPTSKSEVSSQILYGEKFSIISKNKKWIKIKTDYDNYTGYIKYDKFTKNFKPTHKIFKLKAQILKKLHNKFVPIKRFLYFASRITQRQQCGNFIEFDFFMPLIILLSSIAIIYTSLVALAQEDIKKLIAYSSVAHMNLIVMGIFSLTFHGFEGVIIQSLAHGFVSSALFFCIGMLYERFHTRTISHISGLTILMPVFNMFFLMFTMSNIAVPGTSSFIGELLILLGL